VLLVGRPSLGRPTGFSHLLLYGITMEKPVKLTDKQLAKVSSWMANIYKAKRISLAFNVSTIADMYKRAICSWMMRAPAKIERHIEEKLDLALEAITGIHKDNWGRYKVSDSPQSPVVAYIHALTKKYVDDNAEKIKDRVELFLQDRLSRMTVDEYKTDRMIKEHFDQIASSHLATFDDAIKKVIDEVVGKQFRDSFQSMTAATDFIDPSSLESTWAKLMLEMHLIKGDV